jgi:NAD(P)-dependent dehydrogenase (short-subunit alcohol dehydrogenase family)
MPARPTAGDPPGRRILLTGATSGIGLATARSIAPLADVLVLQGREPPDAVAREVADVEARLPDGGSLAYVAADYRDLREIDRLADEVLARTPGLDLVINNAAIPGPPRRTVSADGNELTLQVDYLAPVALTWLLSRRAPQPGRRVVNVASATHLSATLDLDDLDLARGYSPVAAYSRAKLAVVVHTCWLAEHPPHPGLEPVSIHPGVIATGLLHAMFGAGGASPEHAAGNIVEVAGRSGDGGTYYDETRPADPNPVARDRGFQARLLDRTAERLRAAGLAIDVDDG